MKRIASLLLFISVFLGCYAQENTFRFGYLSYDEVLQAMPDYTMVQQKMDTMRQQFQAETLRVEDEFNMKYEEFLDGQRDFPKTILQKRQSELQEMMERNIQFKEESKKELEQTEKLLLAPLKIRLIELLIFAAIGIARVPLGFKARNGIAIVKDGNPGHMSDLS